MKLKLIILLTDCVDTISSINTKESIIFVFDENIMRILDENNYDYISIEDIFSFDDFYKTFKQFNLNLKVFFEKMDNNHKDKNLIENLYSDNGLYSSMLFINYLYLDKFLESVKDRFSSITCILPNNLLKNINFKSAQLFNNQMLSFDKMQTYESFIYIIIDCLNPKLIYVKRKSNFFKTLSKNIFSNLKNIVRKIYFQNTNNSSTKSIFVQSGYEVNFIKDNFSNYNLINLSYLRNTLIDKLTMKKNNYLQNKIINDFVDNNYLNVNKYLIKILNTYDTFVIKNLNFIYNFYQKKIIETKPLTFFYSMGTRDLIDLIICKIANQKNIPLFFFQHGGATIFQYRYFQDYIEGNKSIKKNFFIFSKLEKEILIKNNKTNYLSFGSPKIESYLEKNTTQYLNRVLFLTNQFNSQHFRNTFDYNSNKNNHLANNDIINSFKNIKTILDIKIHPINKTYAKKYFYYLSKSIKNIKLIHEYDAEEIITKYNLVIIHSMCSAIFSQLLICKTNIIIFNKDFDKLKLNDKVKLFLKKRCYVAKNYSDLALILEKYESNILESRWAIKEMFKFYDVHKKNSKLMISEYIKELIEI